MTENALSIFNNQSTDMAVTPDFLANEGPAGNENVGAEDQAVPQIKLLQGLSPEVAEGLVDDARPGMLFNTITKECHHELYLMNLFFDKEWGVFKKRVLGGGYHGSYDTQELAYEAIKDLPGNVDDYELSETAKHVVVIVDSQTGEAKQPAMIYCNSTKLSFSKKWNSQIATTNGDKPRFASVWRLYSTSQKNSKGTFFNFAVEEIAWATEGMFKQAKELFESFRAEA